MNFDELFTNYLLTTSRVNSKLDILGSKLLTGNNPLKNFQKNLGLAYRPLSFLKVLMFLHYCFINSYLESDFIGNALERIKMRPVRDVFETMIQQKVNNPYKLFLQKRVHDTQNKNLSTNQIIFKYMNLLARGSSFSEFLYTFGRYYHNRYQFAIDFNIILGIDLQKIYSVLAKKLKRQKPDESICLQIENIHQKLFVIYYNCYYYRHMKKYVPNWIVTDHQNKKVHSNSKIMSNKSIASISTNHNSPCSGFQIDEEQCSKKMSQSALIESSFKGKQMNQFEISQFGLLKSLERVVEEMTD